MRTKALLLGTYKVQLGSSELFIPKQRKRFHILCESKSM